MFCKYMYWIQEKIVMIVNLIKLYPVVIPTLWISKTNPYFMNTFTVFSGPYNDLLPLGRNACMGVVNLFCNIKQINFHLLSCTAVIYIIRHICAYEDRIGIMDISRRVWGIYHITIFNRNFASFYFGSSMIW
jgi:hypothetical protein